MRVAISPESLAHHLRVAAERYGENMKEMEQAGQERLAAQFARQKAECKAIADTLENAEVIVFNGANLCVSSDDDATAAVWKWQAENKTR